MLVLFRKVPMEPYLTGQKERDGTREKVKHRIMSHIGFPSQTGALVLLEREEKTA